MATDRSDRVAGYEAAVDEHYGVPKLDERILDAVERADADVDALSRDDIAAVDEFHIRGREATRELARLAVLEDGDSVLDVGCGIGGPARALAAEFGCEVVGVDLVDEYVRTATALIERTGSDRSVRFYRANALDLPFDAERFDVLWMQHTSMNVEDKTRLFDELRRVSKPGGTLALYEICAGPAGSPRFPVPWASDSSLNFLVDPDELRETIADAGFEPIEWQDVSAESLAWLRNVVESVTSRPADAPPSPGLDLLMGPETPAKIGNVVRSLEEERIVVVRGVFARR